MLELAGVPLRDRGPAGAQPARRGRARRHRAPARRGRARAAAGALGAAGRGERAVRPVARRGAHAAQRRRAVRARPRRHVRRRARRHRALPGGRSRWRATRSASGRSAAEARARRPPRHPVATVLRTRRAARRRRAHRRAAEARGRVLGALAAGFDALDAERPRRGARAAEDLGRRAALALDNARLYAERSAVAATLQRSLLPPDLPRIPGAQVAARYRRRATGNEVGGDFYDCFATGGGDWALVIGDVCGKGAEAAAITALARYTLRPRCCTRRRPRRCSPSSTRRCCARASTTASAPCSTPRYAAPGRLRASCWRRAAPLPLVLRAGGRSSGRRAGDAAGHRPGARDQRGARGARRRRRARALHGRRRRGQPVRRALGPERLAELLRTLAGADAGAIAEAIEHEALAVQGGRLRDDVAVVVLRVGRAGTVSRPGRGGSAARMKLLVVTPEPVDAAPCARRSARGGGRRGARRLPRRQPLGSRSGSPTPTRRSRRPRPPRRRRSSGSRRRASTPPATPARPSPPVAIQDALATFAADRIVVFSHPEGDRDYREDDGLADAEQRFGVPSQHADRPLRRCSPRTAAPARTSPSATGAVPTAWRWRGTTGASPTRPPGGAAIVLCGVCRAPRRGVGADRARRPRPRRAAGSHGRARPRFIRRPPTRVHSGGPGFLRWVVAERAWADPAGFGVAAPPFLRATPDRLTVDLGPDARLEASSSPTPVGLAACGRSARSALAQLAPGLPQYWQPVNARRAGHRLRPGSAT